MISGCKAESEIEEKDQEPLENESTLNLFDMKGSKKPEY